eukprot:g18772.t1
MTHLPRARPPCRLLLSVLVLASALAGASSQNQTAQVICGATTAIRVEDATGALALDTAVNCADGGEVRAVWAGMVTIDAPISIGSGTFLSITGEDALAEVQGGSQIRLFNVSPSGGLELKHLKLSGGSAPSGGAIHATSATVSLEGCVLDGNDATAGDGGAVWAQGGELTIVGGELSDNTAINSGRGGAVFVVDAKVEIQEGTLFEENRATLEGGGLYCGGAENSTAVNPEPSCTLNRAVFTSNLATMTEALGLSFIQSQWTNLYGGGGAAFYRCEVDITESEFELNYAQVAGGGVFAGSDTVMAIDGCTFRNNTSVGYGGGLVAAEATIGGNTLLTANIADESGGAVFGWDISRTIELNDVVCSQNSAEENGGCFYGAGRGVVNNATSMLGNLAEQGGCIYAAGASVIDIVGGEFAGCRSTGNGGFMYASDGAVVTIMGGTVSNNVAERRAGVVYCSGDNNELGGSKVTIEGGTFTNNQALELGGAIVAWGTTSGGPTPTVVTITGGLFSNNTAKFYGGFIFLEELASLSCQGATISGHYAGDQGGAVYGRDATWVNSSCDLIGNGAPQGAAVYLTHTVGAANFENHEVTDNVASGGSVLYATESSVFAKNVNFRSRSDLQEDSSNRAVQLEGEASLVAEECEFGGWTGETVIQSTNPAAGSLVMDSCSFSESSAAMVVASTNSDAQIRNAVIDHGTIENAATVNDSRVLANRALDCDDPNACGQGECVDSDLGVLCECLANGVCLDGGGALSVGVKTAPPDVTFSPSPVYFELVVSAAAEGSTPAIWRLACEADDLDLQVFPSSGVLPPGDNVTVAVTGNPLREDVGGNLLSRFVVTSVGSDSSGSTAGVDVDVESAFYLCQAFEYALPVGGEGPDVSTTCQPCVTIDGEEGVDCELPGATLASLPLREGYWRSSRQSEVIHSCLHSEACAGGTQVSSSDDYCAEGYKGPYCAVCAGDYREGTSHICHSCAGVKSRLLFSLGVFFALLILLILFAAVVFLIGGLDAVESVRLSLSHTLSMSGKSKTTQQGDLPGLKPTARITFGKSAGAIGGGTASAESKADEEIGDGESNGKACEGMSDDVAVGSPDGPSAGGRGYLVGAGVQLSDTTTDASNSGGKKKAACCDLGDKIKRWASLLPMDKLKIVVVVWQILTVFPSITGVEFPPAYSRFLSWMEVVNLDVGHIFAASCVLPPVNFYQRLLLTTLAPLGLLLVLLLTYWMARRRAGIGSTGVLARRAAWSRHVAAGLLLTFLVFTSTSTMAFKAFPCDDEVVEGESYLRADYSLSCKAQVHTYFRVYAAIMIVIYPIGIPLLYASILWVNRESLNPRVESVIRPEPDGEIAKGGTPFPLLAPQENLKERIEKRRQNPDLVPSMFLWKDFGPDMYYYEVIECGRRILLTGVLIFFAAGTAAQAAMACIFAFVSLLGFELLRPHLDPADSWLYRLGCVVIFLSNFLALLIKVDATKDENRDALGGILIAMNVLLILAVLATSWFTTQQSVDDSREEDESVTLAKTMLTMEHRTANTTRLAREESKRKENEKSKSPSSVGGAGSLRASGGPRLSRMRTGSRKSGAGVVPRAGTVSPATVEALGRPGGGAGGLPDPAVQRLTFGGLELKHLKLSGGSAPSGGAIHATSATVSLEGCVLDGNDATAGDGGAVWAQGGELKIVGGEFSDNTALNSGRGGAVFVVDAKVVIQEGTLFEENRATLEGGGLYCGGAENSTAVDAEPSCTLRSTGAPSGTTRVEPVDAWRMVSMLPFYALSGEHDGDSDPTNDKHFDTIMLPMVLKRYEAPNPETSPATSSTALSATAMVARKSRRKVVVPHRLDVSNFMAPSAGAKGGVVEEHGGRFVLVLRSAVCHLGGESASKGHYVAYAADREKTSSSTSADVKAKSGQGGGNNLGPGLPQSTAIHGEKVLAKPGADTSCSQDSVTWLRLDDLKERLAGRGFVERLDGVREAHEVFSEDLGFHSYMLFYELVPLNLNDADKAQVKETLAYMETATDYMLAEQLNLTEQLAGLSATSGGGRAGGVGETSSFCPVS